MISRLKNINYCDHETVNKLLSPTSYKLFLSINLILNKSNLMSLIGKDIYLLNI